MTSPIDLLYNKLSSIFEKELTLKKLGPNEGYDGIGSSHLPGEDGTLVIEADGIGEDTTFYMGLNEEKGEVYMSERHGYISSVNIDRLIKKIEEEGYEIKSYDG